VGEEPGVAPTEAPTAEPIEAGATTEPMALEEDGEDDLFAGIEEGG